MTLQDTVRYFTEETKILPCLSVTCGGAGLCVQARGGVINEQGTPVSDRTLFDLASLTKLFTGLLTMRLWEEGRLDLTRPVTDYAPQYRYLSDMPVEKVLGFEIGLTTPERIDTQKTPEAAKQQLWAVQPGEIRGRAYSDIHAMVIRDVIEGAAQSEYGAELNRCILRPLEMAETFLHVPEERRVDCISCRGEHRIEQGKHILRTDAQPGIPHDPKAAKLYPEIMGHAGLFSTQGDMVKFAQGVLREQVVSKRRFASWRATARASAAQTGRISSISARCATSSTRYSISAKSPPTRATKRLAWRASPGSICPSTLAQACSRCSLATA